MPPMKTDYGWLVEFRARYADWWPQARPLIEQHDYARDKASQPAPATDSSNFGVVAPTGFEPVFQP